MSQILNAQLSQAKFLVGPKLVRLQGAAEDYFTISKQSDVGAIIGGIQGDTMLVSRLQNAFTASLTLMGASAAIGQLLALEGNWFQVKVSFNDFSFNGKAVLTNVGDWVASLGTLTRTMTLGMAYESGNIKVGIGEVIGTGG